MKKYKHRIQIASLVILLLITGAFIKKQTEPWRPDQLMAPKDLADIINSSTEVKPLIISVGPAGFIKDAIDIGPAQEKENLKKLKKLLSEEKKDREIVIYCGCCPFQKCPNIRPAFSLLNSMKFTRHKLLDLPHNLKADWINYGYPMATGNKTAQ
jgi:thiosulfate/3-mercaptopyruvate sulfurtransferase